MPNVRKLTFEEFFKDLMVDEDVWNMSLETYNFHKRRAKELYNIIYKEDEENDRVQKCHSR